MKVSQYLLIFELVFSVPHEEEADGVK